MSLTYQIVNHLEMIKGTKHIIYDNIYKGLICKFNLVTDIGYLSFVLGNKNDFFKERSILNTFVPLKDKR